MRQNQLLSVLLLFLLVPASITRAQTATLTGTVSIEQDHRAVNFNSPNGNVKVILPGNLSGPGQGTVLLSGTVFAEPVGKTEKEKTSNLKALQKMLLTIGGKSISILPGQNHFDFSLPRNLATPVPIDLVDPKGDRATVILKNPVISPPPTTGILSPGQPSLTTDQKVYLTNGNIPVYAANNESTLFQPTDKFFIKDASGNMTEATIVAQSPTQTVLSSQGIQPGATTIVRQSANRTDQVNIRMASLALSSPNTNLRSGQTSTVTVTVDPKITDKDSAEAMQIPIMSLDVKNLAPNIVEMSGGNMQVMNFPTTAGGTSPALWQATRTITGVTPGNFNISATLYPSTALAGPFEAQQKALSTPGDFNRWVEGIKNDLEKYIKNLGKDQNELKGIAQYALNNMPTCSSVDDLEICKWAAGYLLRLLPDLKRIYVNGAAAFAAYQATSNSLANEAAPAPDFIHTDIIQNGLKLIENISSSKNDPVLKQGIVDAKNAAVALQNDYSTKNISTLAKTLNGVNTTTSVANLMTSSFYSIGWSFSCDDCTKICENSNKKCDLGVHYYDVEIKGKNFTDKNGHLWQKKRKFKYECREEKCYDLWGDLCCAYRITTDAEEVNNGEFWEEGIPNGAGGVTWGPPHDAMPCQCGTLFDILTRVDAFAFLEDLSWEERIKKLESQLKSDCPDLTLENLPGMAKSCGFPNADKKVTDVSGKDLLNWVQGILEGLFHENHGK